MFISILWKRTVKDLRIVIENYIDRSQLNNFFTSDTINMNILFILGPIGLRGLPGKIGAPGIAGNIFLEIFHNFSKVHF